MRKLIFAIALLMAFAMQGCYVEPIEEHRDRDDWHHDNRHHEEHHDNDHHDNDEWH
ncbi:MAG TPA: hypothetical protein VNY36_01395 [Bacteroidia bacterium]|jgi:hypothetical protein|nr:hypothetical protein [Bacteroidia bacterium]